MSDEFRRWKYDAVESVRRSAGFRRGRALTAHYFSEVAEVLHGCTPPDDPRWWGQAMLEAADLGYVCRCGDEVSPAPYARGRRVALWRCR